MRLPDRVFDVVIIGAGIHGASVARDCAMRRLSVAVVEQNDIGSGSSGNGSGMIYGGPRALLSESELAKRIVEDGNALQRIAPNLVYRIPILVPILESDPMTYRAKLESYAALYDKIKERIPSARHRTLAGNEIQQLDAGFSPQISSAITVDELAVDSQRLITLTMKAAVAAGATLLTHTKAENLEFQSGHVSGVTIRENGNSKSQTLRARCVVNLTGPWSHHLGLKLKSLEELRFVKRVYMVFERRFLNVGIVCRSESDDGSVFLLPQGFRTVLGAVQTPFFGHADKPGISYDEIGYLLHTAKRFFPSVMDHRPLFAQASLKLAERAPNSNELGFDNDHLVLNHDDEGAKGVYSMLGGSFGSSRLLAERLTDDIAKRLKKNDSCRTHMESLPGCTAEMPWREESKRGALNPITVKRLMNRHGYHATQILDSARRDPELGRTVCECEQILAAEIDYCIREEWAKTPSDLSRRTGVGRGSCRGARCTKQVCRILGRNLRWTNDEALKHAYAFQKELESENRWTNYGFQARADEYSVALNTYSNPDGADR